MVMVRLLSACAPSKAPGPKESLRHRHQQPWPGWFMVCRTQGGSELRGKAGTGLVEALGKKRSW